MGDRNRERGIQEVDRTNPPSSDQLPVTCFFPPGATSGLSPPSNNAITGGIRRLSRSPAQVPGDLLLISGDIITGTPRGALS